MVCSCDPRTAHGGQGRASSARLRVSRSFWRRSNWSPAHMAAPDPISSCSPSTGRRSPRRPRSAPAARARAHSDSSSAAQLPRLAQPLRTLLRLLASAQDPHGKR